MAHEKLFSGLPGRSGSRHIEHFHSRGGRKGEKRVGEVIIELDFGEADLGDISHDVLNPGLENLETLPIHDEKELF